VSINELAMIVIEHSGKRRLTLRHVPGPEGVRGRNSDNRRLRDVLGWEPSVALRDGLGLTYSWIAEQVGGDTPIPESVPVSGRRRPASIGSLVESYRARDAVSTGHHVD
jgi:hypothetical protein